MIAFLSLQLLLRRRNDRIKIVTLTYTVVMLCLVCSLFAVTSVDDELDIIESRVNHAKGANCIPIDVSRYVLNIVIVWTGDGLLVKALLPALLILIVQLMVVSIDMAYLDDLGR